MTRFELWYGRDVAPAPSRSVRSGRLVGSIDGGGDLRHFRIGGDEVLRRLFVGVRDKEWNTISGELSDFELETHDDSFTASFRSRHRSDEIDFEWTATIAGSPDATLTYELNGIAHKAFPYCRIGLCVLHPPVEYGGRPYRARSANGTVTSGTLPVEIGPQLVENGIELPLFPAFDHLDVDLGGGILASHEFEGDLFETEDQRNWTDASFKTYSTPLALGYPHQGFAGKRFHQRVTLKITSSRPLPAPPAARDSTELILSGELGRTLPQLGLAMVADGPPLSKRESGLLGQLSLDHLRVELDVVAPDHERQLQQGLRSAEDIGCGLELAVFLTEQDLVWLDGLVAGLPHHVPVTRLLIFHRDEPVTPAALFERVRDVVTRHLPATTVVGGTNLHFAQLNAARSRVTQFEALVYPITPQVHAFDDTSLVEALGAQEDTVVTARSFFPKNEIVVSPITLRPRFNSDAAEHASALRRDGLPPNVDPRQMSLLAGGWTLGSVRALCAGGTAAATYYETAGSRGVIERDAGSSIPELFRSQPGMVYPIYHVLADLGEWKGLDVLPVTSSDSLAAQAMGFRTPDGLALLVANLSPDQQRVVVSRLPGASPAKRRVLDADTADAAMFSPARFRATFEELQVPHSGRLEQTLQAYSVVRLDLQEHHRP